jgi:xanthine/CO dehydrogenase XdhC/CoxF family maturation factor
MTVAGVAALATARLVLPPYASTVGSAPTNNGFMMVDAAAGTVFGSNVDGSSGETFAVALTRQDTKTPQRCCASSSPPAEYQLRGPTQRPVT